MRILIGTVTTILITITVNFNLYEINNGTNNKVLILLLFLLYGQLYNTNALCAVYY